MRKQYYIREVKGDTLIWEVDQLVKLTQHLPPREVMLESIKELDENFWFQGDEVPSVRNIVRHIELAEKASLKYPVILSSEGRVMDGMHRVMKAMIKGEEMIKVVQFLEDPEPDYVNKSLDELEY